MKIEELVKDKLVNEELVKGKLVNEELVKGKLVNEELVKGKLVNEELVRGKLVDEELVKGKLVDLSHRWCRRNYSKWKVPNLDKVYRLPLYLHFQLPQMETYKKWKMF